MIAAWLGSVLLLTAGVMGSPAPVPHISGPAASYLLNCGGCHGIEGRSSDHAVPTLRGQVDAFLCLPEGREYIVRLPNVAFVPLPDEQLADLLNFVVSFGATRQDHLPYTAAEVGALRRRPLIGAPIAAYRLELVRKLIAACGAPRSLLYYK
jgi:hypothetical protein